MSVVGFTAGILVEGLKVNGAPRLTIFLGANDHAVAPFCWCVWGDWFQDTKAHIFIKTGFDLVLVV